MSWSSFTSCTHTIDVQYSFAFLLTSRPSGWLPPRSSGGVSGVGAANGCTPNRREIHAKCAMERECSCMLGPKGVQCSCNKDGGLAIVLVRAPPATPARIAS